MEIKVFLEDGENTIVVTRKEYEFLKKVFEPEREKEVIYVPTSPPMEKPYELTVFSDTSAPEVTS